MEQVYHEDSLVDALIDGEWVPAKVYSKSYVVKKPNGDITSMDTRKSGFEFLYHEYTVLVNCEEGNFRRVYDNPANVGIRDPTLICPSQMQPQRNRRQNLIKSPMNNYIKKDDENYMTLSNILNPDAEELEVKGTVQEVFQQLKHYLSIVNRPDKCSDRNTIKNIEFIRDLIEDIGRKHIKYNKRMLCKEITSLANGGTKRKRNISKKSRRRRSKSKLLL